MRITDTYSANVGGTQSLRSNAIDAGASSSRASAATRETSGDKVELSIGDLVQRALAAKSPERESRIAHLKRQYEGGQYTPDTEALGRALLTKLG